MKTQHKAYIGVVNVELLIAAGRDETHLAHLKIKQMSDKGASTWTLGRQECTNNDETERATAQNNNNTRSLR